VKNITLDIRDVPKELILLLEILKNGDEGYHYKYVKEEFNNIDWHMFLNLAKHHRVYPLLASKIQSFDKGLIPPFVIQTISGLYKQNIFKMLNLSGEMEQLAKIFNTNSIKAIFLKGPNLGKEIYGDISLRTCGDLDLLIPIEDLDKMHRLLVNNGYERDDYIQTVLEDWKWRHHHVTYYHTSKQIKVEIHWRLNPGPGYEPIFFELWARKRKDLMSNNSIYLLGKADLFLFLVSHGARHGWSRLRWLIDIERLIGQGIDWKEVRSLVKKHNNLHIVGQSIILSSQLLNANVTNDMQKFILNNRSTSLAQGAIFYLTKMVNLHNEPLPKDVSNYHVRHLYSLMPLKQKVLFILSYLYPYYIDSVTFPLPKKLHFLYFILRPFLCFWRKAKKNELSQGEQ
jgi:hypothetical protein